MLKTLSIYRKDANCKNSTFSDKGKCNIPKKKVSLAERFQRQLKPRVVKDGFKKLRPLLQISNFYPTSLEAYNSSLRVC